MGAALDVTNKRFGRLRAITRAPTRKKRTFWWCLCDCGTIKDISLHHMVRGKIRSCGCLLDDVLHSQEHAARCAIAAAMPRTHGMSGTPVHAVWKAMIQRCTNPKCHDYRWYGALGVKVCDRWRKFENFYADMGAPPEGLTLDRKEPTKDYEPGNCRWATWEVQRNNKRKHAVNSHSR